MFGAEYVWIIENRDVEWWQQMVSDCNQSQLREAVEGIILVGDFDFDYQRQTVLRIKVSCRQDKDKLCGI